MCNNFINEIRQEYKNGRLIPFIGSGFSKPLGLPDWSGLIAELAQKINIEPDLFMLHGSYQQLLEFVYKTHHREWKDFIHGMILRYDSHDAQQQRKGSATHKALSKLTSVKTIYTTNYDSHIEEALKENGRTVKLLTTIDDFIDTKNKDANCEVLKFHGTLVDDETIVLTESQYFERMSLEAPVDQRLRADLLSNSFLFMGYSFSDPNIRYIWYKIHELKRQQSLKNQRSSPVEMQIRPSYFVTFGSSPIQSKLLETWDIRTVDLDPSDPTESLAKLLNQIAT